jgi:hypothetical protein
MGAIAMCQKPVGGGKCSAGRFRWADDISDWRECHSCGTTGLGSAGPCEFGAAGMAGFWPDRYHRMLHLLGLWQPHLLDRGGRQGGIVWPSPISAQLYAALGTPGRSGGRTLAMFSASSLTNDPMPAL